MLLKVVSKEKVKNKELTKIYKNPQWIRHW